MLYGSRRVELADVDGAYDDKTVNRVNKVAFELIILFRVRARIPRDRRRKDWMRKEQMKPRHSL